MPLSPPLPVPGAGCCGAARMTMPRSTATPAEASREVAARAAPSLFDEGTWPLLRNVLFTLTVLTVVLGAGLVAWGSATGSTLDTLFPNDRFDYVQWTAAFAFVLFVLRTLNHLSGCIGEADVFIFRCVRGSADAVYGEHSKRVRWFRAGRPDGRVARADTAWGARDATAKRV